MFIIWVVFEINKKKKFVQDNHTKYFILNYEIFHYPVRSQLMKNRFPKLALSGIKPAGPPSYKFNPVPNNEAKLYNS